jgi:CheY-like chemotaxis protein
MRDGFRVIEASDGLQALQLAAAHRSEILLLLTDLVMPGMGGRELADRLRADDGKLPVIYISGYSEDSLRDTDDGAILLQKPFRPQDLLRAVHERLYVDPSSQPRAA